MRCGSCKQDHETVAEVRACYGVVEIDGQEAEMYKTAGNAEDLRPISEPQYNFINKLKIERGEPPNLDGYEEAMKTQTLVWAKGEIKRLQELPKTNKATALEAKIRSIPEGRYAVDSLSRANDLDFYLVDKPTDGNWAGFTFVKMIVGGKPEYNVKGARRHDVLRAIAEAGWEVAAKIYSDQTNECSKCGIHLTKYASRQLGYGYICAGRRGLGAEWTRIQNKWEADEQAGLHAIQEVQGELDREAARTGASAASMEINIPGPDDRDEFLRYERVAARETVDQAPFSIEPPAGMPSRELTDAEEAQESATWK